MKPYGNEIKEALSVAGSKYSGHVTIGSLEAQWAVVVNAMAKENDEICQILGKALGYPWYKDDQKNFPGCSELDGVCPGDHVAVSLAIEAAEWIKERRKV